MLAARPEMRFKSCYENQAGFPVVWREELGKWWDAELIEHGCPPAELFWLIRNLPFVRPS